MAGGKYKANAEKSRYSLANKRNSTTKTRKAGVRNRQWQFSEGHTGRPVETPEEVARREAKEAKAAKNAAFLESLKMFDDMSVNDDTEAPAEEGEAPAVVVRLTVGGGAAAAGGGGTVAVTIGPAAGADGEGMEAVEG